MNGSYGEILFIESVLSGTFFACGDKNVSPKSLFVNFTSYGDNSLAVIVYHVVLSMDD